MLEVQLSVAVIPPMVQAAWCKFAAVLAVAHRLGLFLSRRSPLTAALRAEMFLLALAIVLTGPVAVL